MVTSDWVDPVCTLGDSRLGRTCLYTWRQQSGLYTWRQQVGQTILYTWTPCELNFFNFQQCMCSVYTVHHGRMNYKDTEPYISAFLSVDLLTDFGPFCLTDFLDWLVFSAQLVNCCPHEQRIYTARVLHTVSDQIQNLQYCFTTPNKMTSTAVPLTSACSTCQREKV